MTVGYVTPSQVSTLVYFGGNRYDDGSVYLTGINLDIRSGLVWNLTRTTGSILSSAPVTYRGVTYNPVDSTTVTADGVSFSVAGGINPKSGYHLMGGEMGAILYFKSYLHLLSFDYGSLFTARAAKFGWNLETA